MECPKCGAFVTEEDRFCGECGQPLPGRPTPPTQPLTPLEAKDLPTLELDAVPRPPRPAPASPPRKKILPWLLAFGGVSVLGICLFVVAVWHLFEVKPGQATLEVQPIPLMVVYQDDFSDPDSGWDVYDEDDTRAQYLDGEYRVGVYRTDYVAWGNPAEREFADFVVEVDARQVEGPLGSNFGLLVRYQPDHENFYWFEISSDGYYSVDLLRAGQWVMLVDWDASDAIRQGVGATNHLQVECTGSQFRFHVNGSLLTTVTDSAFPSGNIGLAAGTFDEPGTVVHFDNIVVSSSQ